MRRASLHLGLLFCSAIPCAAQSNLANFWGSTANQHLGEAIDRISDLNGDGYADMVVGSPDTNGAGAVYFVSGKYLATGTGFASLGATFGAHAGGLFGNAVISVPDVTGDGIADAVVGEPGEGSVHVISGANKAIVGTFSRTNTGFGHSLARTGDINGDGYSDAVVGEPGGPPLPNEAIVVLSARAVFVGSNPVLATHDSSSASGFAVSAGDTDNDSNIEFVAGAPSIDSVTIFELVNGFSREITGAGGGEFGYSIEASRDFTGDGFCDLLVGAPSSDTVYLLSGAAIMAGPAVQNLSASLVTSWTNGQVGSKYGYSVASTPDMNADGVVDIVIGAPSFDTSIPSAIDRGAVYVISGRTLLPLAYAYGSSGEQLGSAVSRGWDYDGDGRTDIAAGAPYSNQGATDAGILRIYSLFPVAPSKYCAGKLNSQGCTPVIGFNGAYPSVSSASACNVTAISLINNKPGMLLYSLSAAAVPFQGATLCLGNPIKRVGVQSTLGNPPPNDCSGHMTYDFNARIQSGADPALLAVGQEFCCQYWARDPAAAFGSSLSNALHGVVNP